VRLYSATDTDPQLQPVKGMPVMHGAPGAPEIAGAASIAVSGDRVAVIVGDQSFFSSPNGKRWVPRTDPCLAQVQHSSLRTALVTTTDTLGVAVACGYGVEAKSETKRIYISADSGKGWQPMANEPTSFGLLQTFAAGSTSDLVIGTTWGGAEITHNGGQSWSASAPSGVRLSFVGFIDISHIVGVADWLSTNTGAFANTTDAGDHWAVTTFKAAS
jgi:hypothetical protein